MRIAFLSILVVCALVWIALVLYTQYVQFSHRSLLTAIYGRSNDVTVENLDAAITDYTNTLRILPCSARLHSDVILLNTKAADIAMKEGIEEEYDFYLSNTLTALESLLSCTPADGKAWLDYATLNTYREGFTEQSLAAFKMSQSVTPGEAWLAEKRLRFALMFGPLLDEEAIKAVKSDFATLDRGAPFRLGLIMQATGKSKEELYELF